MKKVGYHFMAVPLRDNKRISSGTASLSLLSALETADNRKSDWFQFPETEAMHLVAPARLVYSQMNENLENDKSQSSSEKKEKTVWFSPMTIKLLTNAQRSEKTATSTENWIEAGFEIEITKL